MAKKVAILISGSGSNMQALVQTAAAADYPAEVVAVISNIPSATGLARAANDGIATHVLDHTLFDSREAYDDALHALIMSTGAEIVCLAGFMRILTPEFVNRWTGQMLNIHPSLLPSYRGLHTHRRALADGVTITGCTVHFVVPELDAGPAIIQAAVPVLSNDDEKALAARVLAAEHQIYPQALRWLAEGKVSLNSEGRIQRNGNAVVDTPSILIVP
ncbi:MAG: phosphoribosylglycinamide formyltransferase [Alphaproteobacteria bacterium]|nr:phosphoribosylglycinamide formyltransferase [Alphaproteobacteria bacterium]